MNYWVSYITDVGICKKINQDALLFKTAKTPNGNVILGAIADGLGGLEFGELASNTILHNLSEWFENKLPILLKNDCSIQSVKKDLIDVINVTHHKLADYMEKNHVRLGTTIAILFIFRKEYLIIHVGDTRVYHFDGSKVVQLTKDHTYVQTEIEAGRMTQEDAMMSDKRNILTQCLGASISVMPDSQVGIVCGPSVFLICSDGFRNAISKRELEDMIERVGECERESFDKTLVQMLELLKERKERDNISSLLLRYF